jgi:threonine/homoserine/homoserine lactone efflux protein
MISLTFLASSAVIIVTPGPDAALVAHFVATYHRRREALAAAAGMITAGVGHATLAVTGIVLVLASRPALFTALRIVGAVVLFGWGLQSLRPLIHTPQRGTAAHATHTTSTTLSTTATTATTATKKPTPTPTPTPTSTPERTPPPTLMGEPQDPLDRHWAAWSYLRGLLSTLTNPKVGLFFLTFFPQFAIDHGGTGHTTATGGLALLGAVYLCMCTVWLVTWTELLYRLGQALSGGRFWWFLRLGMALVLLGFGVRLLAS